MTSRRQLSTGLLAAFTAAAALASTASAAAPTDPQAAAQEPLRIMHVGEALDLIARPLADVPVLVADTGLDLGNPDIAPRLFSLPAAVPAPDPDNYGNLPLVAAGAPGWDLIGQAGVPGPTRPDRDPSDPEGGSGHGTAVAGLLGAAWNNGAGGAGVAPNARFIALRTCWDGDQCYEHVQASAIDWAADRGARVASFSWLSDPNISPELRTAIVSHPNTLFVTIPSGNGGAADIDGDGPMPCGLDAPNVLCVSTSAPDDGLDCGGFGPRSVDVAVPTRNSITTVNNRLAGGDGFGPTGCATSFASPTAAGIATILFGIDPTATAADVRAAIVDSARPAAAWQGKSVSGGIADAASAVALFQQRRGIAPAAGRTPTPAPTPSPAPRPVPGRTTPRDASAPTLTVKRSRGRISVVVSEAATLRIAFQRSAPGRRSRGACRRPSRALSTKPACTRWVAASASTRSIQVAAGTTTVRLPTRGANRRALPSGSYRAVFTAKDRAGNRSAARRLGFAVGS